MRLFDPDNPAAAETHTVSIYIDEGYFGELPCNDSGEVLRLCRQLTDFIATKKLAEPSETDLACLKYKPVEQTSPPQERPPSGSMQTLDFLDRYFETWTEAFGKEQCVVLLGQALNAVMEDFFDCPEIVEACDHWLEHRPVFDLGLVEEMQRKSHEADLVYLHREDKGEDKSRWMPFFNRMCVFTGLAGLYGIREIDRATTFGVLYYFGHGAPDLDDFVRRIQIRTVHEIGYNLRVVRSECCFDKPENPITRDELTELVGKNSTFQLRGDRLLWCPEGTAGDTEYFFLYDETDGILSQKAYCDEFSGMLTLAEELGAKVVGEKNEIYTPDGIILEEKRDQTWRAAVWYRLRGFRRKGKYVGLGYWNSGTPIYFFKHFR